MKDIDDFGLHSSSIHHNIVIDTKEGAEAFVNALEQAEESRQGRSKMKTKPILFMTSMVQAIQDGRKTMTRRVINTSKRGFEICRIREHDNDGVWVTTDNATMAHIKPPYQVGDIIWVREAWARVSDWTTVDPAVGLFDGYIYRADWASIDDCPKWRPSIFMPKEAARIWLEVTDIRAERLQEITEEDAKAEGVGTCGEHVHYDGKEYRCQFEGIWNLINAKRGYPWETNPFVWIIAFKRIDKPEEVE